MSQPTLYILMRRDMDSMNAGKAMAQAAHAANQFTYQLSVDGSPLGIDDWLGEAYTGPDRREPSGFGTTLVMGVWSERELNSVINNALEAGFTADTVLDNTYPVKDGKVTHLLPVVTCGYIYTDCRRDNPVTSVSNLELHP